jgi:hypothetical protein
MSPTASDTPDSGQLPGRYEWAVEPERGTFPTNPGFERFSDVIRSFEADAGAQLGRQDALGTMDAVDHNRGDEDPSATIEYDLQRFPVDTNGNPHDASGYGLLRDDYNRLEGTLHIEARREYPGGNDDAGAREYVVVRGAAVDTVDPDLDPSSEDPVLMSLSFQPARVRSYIIHQPASGTTLDLVSTSDEDTMDATVESEGATTAETITLNGTTTVTTTASFSDIDAVHLSAAPTGDVTVSDGGGTTLLELDGGETYSDDNQPVDGDRGLAALGSGSRAGELGLVYEHFVGDRFERPPGSSVRPRVNSAGWTVENNIDTSSLQGTRSPAVDESSRAATIEADVAGKWVTHDSMVESLQKVQADLEHELDGGTITFHNTVPTDSAVETREADQGVASMSETLMASGEPAISLTAN